MRDLLLSLVDHRRDLDALLSMTDRGLLERGQLLITPKMAELALRVLTKGDPEVKSVSVSEGGNIAVNVVTGAGMDILIRLTVERLEAANGAFTLEASYKEERKGGGIGNALLGMTGRSGLSFALSKYKWIDISGDRVRANYQSLPRSLRFSLLRTSPAGILLRI